MPTDLLSVWTDPDTAVHAVGASLGIFREEVADARVVLPAGSPLRHALLDVLLVLVDDGDLEQRACSDGQFAFRWRDQPAETPVATDGASARLTACLAAKPRVSALRLAPVEIPPARDRAASAAAPPSWHRTVATFAPLVLPAVTCVLALLAFVALGRAAALGVAAALALVGVVGAVRRVPLSGFWTLGVVLAAVVLRLS